jgi:hypothetical protein
VSVEVAGWPASCPQMDPNFRSSRRLTSATAVLPC